MSKHWMRAKFEDQGAKVVVDYGLFHVEMCHTVPGHSYKTCDIWPITEIKDSDGFITSQVKMASQLTSALVIISLILSVCVLPFGVLRSIRQPIPKFNQRKIVLVGTVLVVLTFLCVLLALILYPVFISNMYIFFQDDPDTHYPLHKGWSFYTLIGASLLYLLVLALWIFDTVMAFKTEPDETDHVFYDSLMTDYFTTEEEDKKFPGDYYE